MKRWSFVLILAALWGIAAGAGTAQLIVTDTTLTGNGSTANPLKVVQTVMQHRVTGSCTSPNSIDTINQDGTVVCSTGVLNTTNVSGTTNRVAKFTGANTVGDSSINDNGSLVSTAEQVEIDNTTHLVVGTGQAGLVVGTSSKDWTFYPLGSDLHLFEYNSTFGIGGGNERAIFKSGGGLDVESAKISSLAAGTVSTDAVNLGQLNTDVNGGTPYLAKFTGTNVVNSGTVKDNVASKTAGNRRDVQFGDSTIADLFVAGYEDNNGKASIWHNAYPKFVTPGGNNVYWEGTHASFGSRGITFDFAGLNPGIAFFADNAASTADTSFTPTRRMFISNSGGVTIDNLATLTGGFSAGAQSDMTSHKIVNLTNGSSAQDAAAFGQIGTAVNAAVSGVSGRVAVFNGTNSVTGYAGFTSDASGNVITNSITTTNAVSAGSLLTGAVSATEVDATVASGQAAVVIGTSTKDWTWYPSGTGLRLFEYTTTRVAGGGSDRILISAGGATEFTAALTADSTAHIVGALTEDSTGSFAGQVTLSNTVQATERLRLTGQEFFASGHTDTDGPTLLLGINRAGNRQIWIADSASLTQNATNNVIAFNPVNTTGGVINSESTNGTNMPLFLNPSAGGTVNIGNGGLSVTGNTTLGDAASDSTTVNGRETVAYAPSASTGNDHALDISLTGTFNVTGGNLFPVGVNASVTSTRSAGANNVNNIAFYGNASGGQTNTALWTDAGDIRLNQVSGTIGVVTSPSSGFQVRAKAGTAGNGVVSITDANTSQTTTVYEMSIDTTGATFTGGGGSGPGTPSYSTGLPSGTQEVLYGGNAVATGLTDSVVFYANAQNATNNYALFSPHGDIDLKAGNINIEQGWVEANTNATGRTSVFPEIQGIDNGSYNTTSGAITAQAGYFQAGSSRSAGANNLTNIGVYTTASGGQVNQSLYADAGDVVLNGSSGTTTIGGATTVKANLTVATGAGTAKWTADTNGHVHSIGTAPSLTSCGTGPTVVGGDAGFKVHTGTSGTTCTITFANAYTTNAPSCTVWTEGSTVLPTCTVSTTAISCTTTVASTNYDWQCVAPN